MVKTYNPVVKDTYGFQQTTIWEDVVLWFLMVTPTHREVHKLQK